MKIKRQTKLNLLLASAIFGLVCICLFGDYRVSMALFIILASKDEMDKC